MMADGVHDDAESDISGAISLEYSITADEILDSLAMARRKRVGITSIIVMTSMMYVLIRLSRALMNRDQMYWFYSACIIFLAISLGARFLHNRRIEIHFATRFGLSCIMTWRITDQRLAVSDSSDCSSEMPWRCVVKILRVPMGFLLYPDPARAYWIPLRAFDTPADLDLFVAWARDKSGRYVDKS